MTFRARYLLLSVLFAAPAGAQNLLTNSDFTTSTTAWTFTGTGTVTLGTTDANGSSASRSAVVTHTGAGSSSGTFAGIQQCVPASSGRKYAVAYSSFAPPSQTSLVEDYVGVRVEFFSVAGCTGSPTAAETNTAFFTAAYQPYVKDSTPSFPIPAGTFSARVTFGIFKKTAGTLSVTLDALHFGETELETAIVPASASVAGANGTFFRTALWAYSRSRNRTAPLRTDFRCAGTGCDRSTPAGGFVGPGATKYLPDVVASLGTPGSSGALEFTFDRNYAPLVFLTRTYSPSLDGPSTGSTLAGLPPSEARTR